MSTLYELKEEYLTLLSLGDSDDPEEQQAFLDTLDGLMGEIEVKADSYAVVLKELAAQKEKVEAERKRLQRSEKAIENSMRAMKERIKDAMIEMGKTEIKTDLHTFNIQKNGGVQPMKITGEVPDRFQKVIYDIDTEKIREALTAGEELDFAHLEPRGTQLRIR